ncbi:hypothetical protein SDC9_184103 [bioreactor metagenome]|uniref:Ferrous iron transporter FeoA-like domain-containing protein n=1 Tax=bioreactor metagenome TaxID=1076179 RepID=A0A645HKD6_9ZZZZ|nr:FeoA family protein [Clostridia bacterium]MDD4798789.1 FeoA family protein [Clostridia bacterium]
MEKTQEIPITSLKQNSRGIIAHLDLPLAERGKLMEMGLTEGTEVILRHRAPFGDPYMLELRGYMLALRRDLIERIYIRPV